MRELTDEELMAMHDLLHQEYETARELNDDEKILICGKKYLQFIDAHHLKFGIAKEEIIEAAKYIEAYDKSHNKSKAADKVLEESTRELIKSARQFGESLWHHMRRLSSAPSHIKLTPDYNKSYRQLCEFWNSYEKGLDKFAIEHLIDHLQIRLDFYKQMLATRDEFALPRKKLDLLETALTELRNVFEAEGDTQEEDSMTAYEAKRVRDLFNKIDRSASAPVIRGGH